MKICLVTLGTRGDVQPYLALGLALQARGHRVVLAAPENFADWVLSKGLAFQAMGLDMEAFLQSPEIRKVLAGNWFALGRIWRQTVGPMMSEMLDATWKAGQDADVIIYHPKAIGAPDVAEATGAALVFAPPIPILPSSKRPFFLFPWNLGGWFNRLSYLPLRLSRFPYIGRVNRWRRDRLNLGKGKTFPKVATLAGRPVPVLLPISPSVYQPTDDWGETINVCGYWFFDDDADWEPDESLAAFLAAGPPPIYIGFGSMTVPNSNQLFGEIIKAVVRAKCRAVLAAGWSGIDVENLPSSVHMIEGAPHDALFPLMAGVVHHGGAGTTAAGLRAGKPSLVCPVAVDQPFWGRTVHKLGCGPKPLPVKRLTAARLARRLKALTGNEAYAGKAQSLAAAIATEGGIGEAIRVIEAQVRA